MPQSAQRPLPAHRYRRNQRRRLRSRRPASGSDVSHANRAPRDEDVEVSMRQLQPVSSGTSVLVPPFPPVGSMPPPVLPPPPPAPPLDVPPVEPESTIAPPPPVLPPRPPAPAPPVPAPPVPVP